MTMRVADINVVGGTLGSLCDGICRNQHRKEAEQEGGVEDFMNEDVSWDKIKVRDISN